MLKLHIRLDLLAVEVIKMYMVEQQVEVLDTVELELELPEIEMDLAGLETRVDLGDVEYMNRLQMLDVERFGCRAGAGIELDSSCVRPSRE